MRRRDEIAKLEQERPTGLDPLTRAEIEEHIRPKTFIDEHPQVKKAQREQERLKEVANQVSNATPDDDMEVARKFLDNLTKAAAQPEQMAVFDSGARRSADGDDTRLDLLPYRALHLIGKTLKLGAQKYGDYNWQKGIPVETCFNHCLRHIYLWLDGDRSENHISHAACNLMFILHYLHDELDQLPP